MITRGWQGVYKKKAFSQVYNFKFDLQQGSLTVQVAGEHQPYKKTSISSETKR